MAIIGYGEASLDNSVLYKTLQDKEYWGENPLEKARALEKNSRHLSKEDIESMYVQLKKYSNTLTRAALRAYDVGDTILLYNGNDTMIKAIPFMTLRRGNQYKTYVFMDRWVDRVNVVKNNAYVINVQVLHDLLLGAAVSNGLKTNYANLTNHYMQTMLMNLYTQFVCRIINKKYLLGSEKVLNDTLVYYVNRFFLNNVLPLSLEKDRIELAAKDHFTHIEPIKYDEIKSIYDQANPNDLIELMDLIRTLTPRVNSLDFRKFMQEWMTYYQPTVALAADTIEYLIFMIIALKSNNGSLVSVHASKMVTSMKTIKQFDSELLKLI